MSNCRACVPGRSCDKCRDQSRERSRRIRQDPAYRARELEKMREATQRKRAALGLPAYVPPASQVKRGDVFGSLTVVEVLTATEAGHPQDGAWARCRCVCRKRVTVRARHLRNGYVKSCGCVLSEGRRAWLDVRRLHLGEA